MSTVAAPPQDAPQQPTAAPDGSAVATAVAALAVVGATTALAGVLSGQRWIAFVVVTVAVVAGAGVLLRALRLPAPLVALGQLAALTGLVTAVFSRSGVLAVLPGPAALAELRRVLAGAGAQMEVGVPPVVETTELLCLVVLTTGLVAVAVDVLAVAAGAPAAAGLVLLCVFAVPASLADELLPGWTFVAGVLGFALLLTVDGQRRHLVWGEPAGPGAVAGSAPAAAAVSAGAVVLALLAGVVLTGVGTEGRLPGGSSAGGGDGAGIGLNPFTSLRGQLDRGEVTELLRVSGLQERAYVRAMTLSRFRDEQGWEQAPLDGGAPAEGPLPLPGGLSGPVPGTPVRVRIEPIEYTDNWLPSIGVPTGFAGVGSDWRYDPDALTAFSDRRQRAEPYLQDGVLPRPDPALLRAAPLPVPSPDPLYVDAGGVDPRVGEIAREVTAGAPTAFDAVLALNRWFTDAGNGFRYELQTTPGNSGDALVDFLTDGRAGYCEQYASSMAIMLRILGIPARVAVGFTPGVEVGNGVRLITTEDAHAWVEAFFPGAGWLTFDPTPLADGRAVVPPYVAEQPAPAPAPLPAAPEQVPTAPRQPPTAPPDAAAAPTSDSTTGGSDDSGVLTVLGAVGTVGAVLALAAAPAAVRRAQRRRRVALAGSGAPGAASAAWEEVLAESTDRGVEPPAAGTVRSTARALAGEHGLDEPGRDGLRVLVGAVERSWYGEGDRPDPEVPSALTAVRESLQRCAPPDRRTRLLPRSVVRRPRR